LKLVHFFPFSLLIDLILEIRSKIKSFLKTEKLLLFLSILYLQLIFFSGPLLFTKIYKRTS